MRAQQDQRLLVRTRDDVADFLINQGLRLVAELGVALDGVAEKGLFVITAEVDQAQLLAHAELGDHATRDARHHGDVGTQAGADVVEHDFFGGAAAQADLDAGQQLPPRMSAAVVLRLEDSYAQRLAMWHDGDLGDGVGARCQGSDQRVAGLVESGQAALFLINERRALDAQHDAVESLVKVAHVNKLA